MDSSPRNAIFVVALVAISLNLCYAGTCDETTTVTIPDVGGIGDCLQMPFNKEIYQQFVEDTDSNDTQLRQLVMNDMTNTIDLRYLTCSDGSSSDNLVKTLFSVAKTVSCLDLASILSPIGLINLSADLAGILQTVLSNLLKAS